MIKLRDILLEKKLRVFDFDDTLVKSNSKVFVINKVSMINFKFRSNYI